MKSFERITALAPAFAEGWTKRAQMLYQMGDFSAATRHLGRAPALEPCHFLALAGLGLTQLRLGQERQALEAFEKALAVNPYSSGARPKAEALKAKLRRAARPEARRPGPPAQGRGTLTVR